MAELDREDARKWRVFGKGAWTAFTAFGAFLNFYSFFSGVEITADSIWRFSPWPREAVLLSLGFVFLLLLIRSSISLINPIALAVWDYFRKPQRERERREEVEKRNA